MRKVEYYYVDGILVFETKMQNYPKNHKWPLYFLNGNIYFERKNWDVVSIIRYPCKKNNSAHFKKDVKYEVEFDVKYEKQKRKK